MLWIIFILGFAIIGFCLAILIAPECLRRTIRFLSIGSRVYLSALLHIAAGIILLLLSAQAGVWWYAVTIGFIAIAGGFSLFFFPLKRTRELLSRLQNKSNLFLRLYALIALGVWALVLAGFWF